MQSNPDIQPPVVLIPGALGSRLAHADTGQEVWPGPVWKIMFADYSELALEIDPETLEPLPDELVVSGLTDKAAGRDFYSEILRVLEEYGGYRRATAGEPLDQGSKHYYVFTYDWRQDNVRTVRKLDAFLEQAFMLNLIVREQPTKLLLLIGHAQLLAVEPTGVPDQPR